MRNTSTALALLLALLALPRCTAAQGTTDDQTPVETLPRLVPDVVLKGHTDKVSYVTFSADSNRIETTSDDNVARTYRLRVTTAETLLNASECRALNNLIISADGDWMVAEEQPNSGDGNVRVWSTERDATFTIERGYKPRISRDSRWVSAFQKPPLKATKTDELRAGQTLVLLDTQDGSQRTFDSVLSYDVSHSSMWLVYLQSPETESDEEEPSKDEATKPAAKLVTKKRKLGTLRVVHLESDKVVTMENVAEYASHQTTDHFAYVLRDNKTGRDTLHVGNLGRTGGSGIRSTYNGEKIESLCWAHNVVKVGFLDRTESTGKDGKRRVISALYTWHVPAQSVHGKFTRVDTRR